MTGLQAQSPQSPCQPLHLPKAAHTGTGLSSHEAGHLHPRCGQGSTIVLSPTRDSHFTYQQGDGDKEARVRIGTGRL